MISIKDHGKYNSLIIAAMLELEKALMEIELGAVNEIKAKFE